MIKKIVLFASATLVFANESLLSTLKRKEIELDRQKSIVEAKKLHDSWINPVNASYTYQEGNQYPNQQFESFQITVDQPIFKSGGIYKAIQYANAVKNRSLIDVDIKKRALVFKVLDLAFTYHKLKLQEKKQKLLIENAALDVLIKKEQYLHQEIDSTYLDNAILNKNSLSLALLELQDKIEEVKSGIENLSDLDPDTIKLPTFKLLPKKRFLERNLALQETRKDIEAKKHYKYMSIARYLPTVSLFANYTYQKMQGSIYFPGYSYTDHYTTYGIRVSMPLFDINAPRNIESAKVDYLKAKNALAQKRREKQNFYIRSLKKLQIIDKKIDIASKDLALYKRLYKDTLDRFEAGEKTRYDVQIMKNSLETKKIDIALYRLERQQVLLKLYQEVNDAI